MTLMIDGRTERPVVGETYRQFFVSKEQGDAETPFDEGAVRIVTVNEDRIAFETLDEPSWVKDARPVELRDVGGVAHARTSNVEVTGKPPRGAA